MPEMKITRLAERAVRGPEPAAPHVRWPLKMLQHVLEAEPLAADPLAEVHLRLECIRSLQRELQINRFRTYYLAGAVYRPVFNPGSILAGLASV